MSVHVYISVCPSEVTLSLFFLQIEKIVLALAKSNPAQQEMLLQKFRASPEMRMNLLTRANNLRQTLIQQQQRRQQLGEGRVTGEGRGGEGRGGEGGEGREGRI